MRGGGYRDKKGNTYWGRSRILFLGVLYGGPSYNAQGDIVVKTIPTIQPNIGTSTAVMTNLGYYIKATEFEEFKNCIMKILNER